ncbi:hypothetical protein [Croceitalea dokdonensis]|uniref:hypothetical protein n=1 Tax=Croceitalea dokdonensis TaxID=346188 RepID=UPI0012FAEC10|nr:hypothetical protein [Croceitalea dokdonensis]
MDKTKVKSNHFFSDIYASVPDKHEKHVKELDNWLLSKTTILLPNMFSDRKIIFIESCYRLYDNKIRYVDFEPIDIIVQRVNALINAKKNVLGIHIRQTDHAMAIEKSPVAKFVEMAKKELDLNPHLELYLSTDNHRVINTFKSVFSNRLIYQTVTSYNRNSPFAIQDAVVDLYALSKTEKIYGSHQSTFNQTAADIGGLPLKIVH